MPQYSNVHAHLENNELHPPRDFSLALPDTTLGKNMLGELQWNDTYWQRPVKALWDGSQIPVSPNNGDRYLVLDESNITLHADWPQDVTYNCLVEYFTLNNNGDVINEWQTVQPQTGYRVHVVDVETVYFYDGSSWKPEVAQAVAPVAFQESITRADLLTLRDSGDLVPGKRYYISDKDVILTAIANNRLSTQGDHTRVLPAHGYYDLDGWSTGDVSSVQYDAQELLGTNVSHTGNTVASVEALAQALQSIGHGALACYTRLIVFALAGSSANGTQFQITVDGVTDNSSALAHGMDKGTMWFNVEYDIDADRINAMSDAQGNQVYADAASVSTLGVDPIDVFPWGYAQVRGNRVHQSVLTAYKATGAIVNNELSGGSTLAVDGFQGAACTQNELKQSTLLSLKRATGNAMDNAIRSGSQISLNAMESTFINNQLIAAYITADAIQAAFWAYNNIQLSVINAVDITDPATEITQNRILNCNAMDMAGFSGSFKANTITSCEFTATNCAAEVQDNHLNEGSVTLTDLTASAIFKENNLIRCTMDITALDAEFRNNLISDSTITALNCQGNWINNEISMESTITLNDFAGTEVLRNTISNSSLLGSNVSTQLFNNNISGSTISMNNYTGSNFIGNQLTNAEVDIDGAVGRVDGNTLLSSHIIATNSLADFVYNQLRNDSWIQADGFAGLSCSFCELVENSRIIASNATETIGRVFLRDITTVDLAGTSNTIYVLEAKWPNAILEIIASITEGKVTPFHSSLMHQVTIVNDEVTFDQVGARYCGWLYLDSSNALNTVSGMEYAPEEFILKPVQNRTVTFSSSSTTNIKLPQGISNLNLQGGSGDYVICRKSGTLVVIQSIHVF